MRIAIIQFPGNNCELESIYAVQQAEMNPEEFLWNRDYGDLDSFDGYFIVGGFSYEDRSRSGVIAALDPIMKEIKRQSEKGKPVLGVCNGAQILVESGLVPGLKDYQAGTALAVNKRVKDGKILGTGFLNIWTKVTKTRAAKNAFTSLINENDILDLPVAHGEGRFLIPSEITEIMKSQGQYLLQYCEGGGEKNHNYPVNPNGSMENLAAIGNPGGNVMAIMPHPERTAQGQVVFQSMKNYLQDKKSFYFTDIHIQKPELRIESYQKPTNAKELTVSLIITDNEAVTVENAIQLSGIQAKIAKYTHWEIVLDEDVNQEEVIEKIISSGELYNSNKERPVEMENFDSNKSTKYLVKYKDDFAGQAKKQTLEANFDISGINRISKGQLWKVTADDDLQKVAREVLDSRILFNQFSQDCFLYNYN
jgi:phosphoribosylformylglycinamidine synthase